MLTVGERWIVGKIKGAAMAEWNQKRVDMASATLVLRMIISYCMAGETRKSEYQHAAQCRTLRVKP